MKNVSKKIQSTKLNDESYVSLNGDMLNKIKGGIGSALSEGNKDGNCSSPGTDTPCRPACSGILTKTSSTLD